MVAWLVATPPFRPNIVEKKKKLPIACNDYPPYSTSQSASLPVADEMERPILYTARPADLNSSA